VVFGPRQEIVQAIPVATAAAPKRAAPRTAGVRKAAAPAQVAATGGNFVVQLGAYQNTGVARDAWARIAKRVPALVSHKPSGVQVKTAKGNFYRLSVVGFSRNDAVTLCGQVKASGGNCFVRTQAGDAVASWTSGASQVASR
jgi:cell division septation protein DedD